MVATARRVRPSGGHALLALHDEEIHSEGGNINIGNSLK
jgi:hypothetical protein